MSLKKRIIELRNLGFSYKKIENKLKCARGTISYHCKNENLNKPLPQPNKLSEELISKIKEDYITKTITEVAKKHKISKSVVRKYCNDINIDKTINKPKKNKTINKPKKKHTIVCVECGGTWETTNINGKFCTQECKVNYIRKEKIAKWLNGEHDGVMGKTGTSRWIKYHLIETYGEKCMECGWCEKNQYTNKIPIELEHIDGDYTNNKIENLKLLCPNCHSLTPTYKGANKKNGRPRSKYYRGL